MRYGKAFVLLAALLTISGCQSRALSVSEERESVLQFLNYVDSINKIQHANVANIVGDFLRGFYNNIPEQDRGSSAAILKSYLDELDHAKTNGDVQDLIKATKGFKEMMERLQNNMMKQEAEDMIIMPSMFGFLMLVPQMSAQHERFLEKFNNAADALTARFTAQSIGRNEKLYNILTEFKNLPGAERSDELAQELHELRSQYA